MIIAATFFFSSQSPRGTVQYIRMNKQTQFHKKRCRFVVSKFVKLSDELIISNSSIDYILCYIRFTISISISIKSLFLLKCPRVEILSILSTVITVFSPYACTYNIYQGEMKRKIAKFRGFCKSGHFGPKWPSYESLY